MAFFSESHVALEALRAILGEEIDATEVPAAVQRLRDEELLELIAYANSLVRGGEAVRIAATGAVAARSTRAAGQGGLAQGRGHRSTVALIQDLTGSTRADAAKQVRLGEALLEGAGPTPGSGSENAPDASTTRADPVVTRPRRWHAVLGDALLTGALTSAQHDAIFRGLGEPPASVGMDDEPARAADELAAAWALAAEQLIEEAGARTVEELASAARTIRDLLDPAGAERRFDERFENRGFRTWIDREGVRRGSFCFDDEGGAWVDAIISSALRPRRGGPRFVDPDEKSRADELVADPRTNDQLAYDLIIDVLRAGSLAEPDVVFGTRQAGVRVVATATAHDDALAGRPAVALLEDSDTALPGWLVATRTCDSGVVPVILDPTGNPLDLGREARLFNSRQRLALAIRDGGCLIPGCDRPASYCEAHHIDEYARGGRTDIDRGLLLCRFHHLNLHHHGWRITRDGRGDFVLHIPGRPSVVLRPRLARRYAWGDFEPPHRRFRPAA